jgi:hypothetical protein
MYAQTSSFGGYEVRFRSNGRAAALAAVSAAVLVPLGVFGAPALARSASAASEYEYSSSSQYQYKVAVCHHTHSKKHPWHVINVSSAAVKAHLRHGDTLAPCPTTAPAPVNHGSGQNSSGGSHGQSGDQHGKSGDQHGQSGEQHGQSGSHGNGHGK